MQNLCGRAFGGWAQTLLLSVSLLVISSQLMTPAYAAQVLSLNGPAHSREGYFQLQVGNLQEGQRFVIEQSSNESFNHVDATYPPLGSFQQLSLSGFDNGSYFFRARLLQDSESIDAVVYSNIHQISVEHYSLWQALSLFAIGAMLFIALITVLLRLHWQNRAQTAQGLAANHYNQHGPGHG